VVGFTTGSRGEVPGKKENLGQEIIIIRARNLKERWEAKRLHGQFPRTLDEGLIDKEQSYRWLKFGDIKGETESVIMAAQD
jgi:hypothetical protein